MNELLKNCLDDEGRIKVWPKKHARKDAVLLYLSRKFDYEQIYTEKEVNALLEQWHTFNDYFLLRRALIEAKLLSRDAYGREYRRVCEYPHIVQLIREHYGLRVIDIRKASLGAGSDTYFVTCSEGKYVVKFPCTSGINHPEQETALCEYLCSKGISVSRFLYNQQGSLLSFDGTGKLFHVQEFIEGICPELNTASPQLLLEMAQMLGKIHTALQDYPTLPKGICSDFFRFMTPERTLESYQASLLHAEADQDTQNFNDLHYRIGLLQRLPAFSVDLAGITCGNTHGDYFSSQLLCRDDHITAVIDWTTACVHPLVWEIIRSFVYAAPGCRDGDIPEQELIAYVKAYMEVAPLTREDLSVMLPLFFRQLAVCDYYGQYYASDADNRDIYLHQARFSTKLLRTLEQRIEPLTQALLTAL